MLPIELKGPRTVYYQRPDDMFVEENSRRFPHLDPDFITQICYEHPHRFDDWLPGFDVELHQAKRVERTAAWIRHNVQYEAGRDVRLMWHWQVDRYLETGDGGSPVLPHMLSHQTWPFPPVIVEATLARGLGAGDGIGEPFNLLEGTHRVSYLAHFLDIGYVNPGSRHQIIEILPVDDSS